MLFRSYCVEHGVRSMRRHQSFAWWVHWTGGEKEASNEARKKNTLDNQGEQIWFVVGHHDAEQVQTNQSQYILPHKLPANISDEWNKRKEYNIQLQQ